MDGALESHSLAYRKMEEIRAQYGLLRLMESDQELVRNAIGFEERGEQKKADALWQIIHTSASMQAAFIANQITLITQEYRQTYDMEPDSATHDSIRLYATYVSEGKQAMANAVYAKIHLSGSLTEMCYQIRHLIEMNGGPDGFSR